MSEALTHSTDRIFIFFTMWISLLILCSVLTPACCCDWLMYYGHHSNVSLHLIRFMGGPLIQDRGPVSFPYKFYKDIRSAEVQIQLLFIRDSLKQIFKLYHQRNLSSVAWDADQTDHFLMSIHRQMEELSKCVSRTKRTDRRLRNYYRRLARRTLHITGFSPASWELIRKETKRHLDLLDLLVNSIKAPAAASRGRSAAGPQ